MREERQIDKLRIPAVYLGELLFRAATRTIRIGEKEQGFLCVIADCVFVGPVQISLPPCADRVVQLLPAGIKIVCRIRIEIRRRLAATDSCCHRQRAGESHTYERTSIHELLRPFAGHGLSAAAFLDADWFYG